MNSGNKRALDNVGSVTDDTSTVTNVGVAVAIQSQTHSVQESFPFPVSVAAILNFGSRLTSDNVDRVISESGMVENIGVEVGIATPSLPVEMLFPLSV